MSDIIEVKGHYYIRANASIADAGNLVLKHQDTFAILDRHGDLRPLGFENQGVFHEGTRFVSEFAAVDFSPSLDWRGGRRIGLCNRIPIGVLRCALVHSS